MNKRGFGVQFNWVFVIVAGVIILGFFTLFTVKFIQLQEMKQNVDVSRLFTNTLIYLEGQSAAEGYAIDSSSDYSFKTGFLVDVGYSCSKEDALITINNVPESSISLNEEVVFSAEELKVNSMDSWILSWNYPYFISNFVYLSDPNKKIYIKYDSSTYEFVNDLKINQRFEFDVKLINDLKQVQGDDVTLVWVSSVKPPTSIIKKWKKEISNFNFIRLNINDLKSIYMKGSLDFYEDKVVSVPFYGEEMMYGAIFAEDSRHFSCLASRAKKRFKSVTDVVVGRMDLLFSMDKKTGCGGLYNVMKTDLKVFKDNMKNVEKIEEMSSNLLSKSCFFAY